MWQLLVCVGVVSLILEIFTPSLFFLNFSIAAFLTAIISVYVSNITAIVIIFSILSLLFLFTLRPLLVKMTSKKKQETGIDSKYIGKTARVIETVDKNKGAITIYDERWQARNIDDSEILEDSLVEIVSHESIVMYVKKIDN